jgi:nicotinamidase/pyrazinamidase
MARGNIVLWEVDAQADFMWPGGKLYVPGAEKIAPNIRRLVDTARERRAFLISSGDAHTVDDPEFTRFASHCVKGTPGAEIIPEGLMKNRLTIPNDPSFRLPKNISSYDQVVLEKQTLDVFENPKTDEILAKLKEEWGAEAEYVVFGVVTEYCVRYAAMGLLKRRLKVYIVEDAIETLGRPEGRAALDELKGMGARIVTTQQALAMVQDPIATK